MADEEKIALLSEALSRTDAIIDMFSDVVSGRGCVKHEARSFDSTATSILYPDSHSESLKSSVNKEVTDEETAERKEVIAPEAVHSVPEEDSMCDKRLLMSYDRLCEEAQRCSRCRLCEKRKNVVFGEGVMNPQVLVVGEGPGETEDDTGRPFVGKAGEFLDAWLKAISLDRRTNCYISNIVKCRPPMNRDPQLDERNACRPFLDQQIALLKPRAILCLGKSASTIMTGKTDASMGSLRGRFSLYSGDIPMICTYHPAAVLRDLSLKRSVWDDLQKLAAFLGLEIVRRK